MARVSWHRDANEMRVSVDRGAGTAFPLAINGYPFEGTAAFINAFVSPAGYLFATYMDSIGNMAQLRAGFVSRSL